MSDLDDLFKQLKEEGSEGIGKSLVANLHPLAFKPGFYSTPINNASLNAVDTLAGVTLMEAIEAGDSNPIALVNEIEDSADINSSLGGSVSFEIYNWDPLLVDMDNYILESEDKLKAAQVMNNFEAKIRLLFSDYKLHFEIIPKAFYNPRTKIFLFSLEVVFSYTDEPLTVNIQDLSAMSIEIVG